MGKICINCQKPFLANSGKQKFCSDKCKVAFSRKSTKEPILEIPKTKLVIEKSGKIKEKPSDEKIQTLNTAMDKLNKDFGAGTVMYFGDKQNKDYQVISTGSIGLDAALGIGGLPKGRMIEIFGWEVANHPDKGGNTATNDNTNQIN